jgi:enoyl-[acyl-carrier protein] reductase/trans-2-enoyl-CoA reductase (NAD+)
MIIKPLSKGFVCVTAHPDGCARNVEDQIAHVERAGRIVGPRRVLVIGASTGYGLASRITAAFGAGAATAGVFFERPSADGRTATPGWYNTAAFERAAARAGIPAFSLNGDAFSDDVKRRTLDLLQRRMGPVDLVVYSLAAPRRTHPVTGEVLSSTLKPIGRDYTSKTVNVNSGVVSEVTLTAARPEEIAGTVGVMGGDDWSRWIDALEGAGLLTAGANTVAYSYIGPSVTAPIYREGTIGRAKDDLESTARSLHQRLSRHGGRAAVSVNKALVTQASAAIPAMPLYIAILYRVMKDRGLHEGCIEQIRRLFADSLYAARPVAADSDGRWRIDDWEMRDDVQAEVSRRWAACTTENVESLADLAGFREDFFRLFGFGADGVDYAADTDPVVGIPSLENSVTA